MYKYWAPSSFRHSDINVQSKNIMKTLLVSLLAISVSTNASKVTEKRGITSTGDFGSEHDGLYSSGYSGSYGSAAWNINAASSIWTSLPGFSHQPHHVSPFKDIGFSPNFGHGYPPPTEINTYIQPTRIITKIVRVPVHVPHPVPVKYPVPHPVRVEVDRPVPVPVPHPVPVYINQPYPVNINRPVPVYIEKPVAVPVTVGHNAEYHGSNTQVGAPVVEQDSSGYGQSSGGNFGQQEHYSNPAPAVRQVSSGNAGQQSQQDNHQNHQQLNNSYTHSDSGSQSSQQGYNYEAPPKSWN